MRFSKCFLRRLIAAFLILLFVPAFRDLLLPRVLCVACIVSPQPLAITGAETTSWIFEATREAARAWSQKAICIIFVSPPRRGGFWLIVGSDARKRPKVSIELRYKIVGGHHPRYKDDSNCVAFSLFEVPDNQATIRAEEGHDQK